MTWRQSIFLYLHFISLSATTASLVRPACTNQLLLNCTRQLVKPPLESDFMSGDNKMLIGKYVIETFFLSSLSLCREYDRTAEKVAVKFTCSTINFFVDTLIGQQLIMALESPGAKHKHVV